ncbi:hypothetical protein BG015_009522 [Linnemannia schmuckeri]|uniref:Uncharacterized protein n=1 Tax=Linnemannia schmuckeri TaxID=64567 RepID=A0A9P5S5F3_9FUNG|nr:hypothetical protein BG015_009522 [Linnemannia schmuckeri]
MIYATETTTSLQPTLIPDPRQPPPSSSTFANRSGFHPWQIGLVVALVLILLALCLAAVILTWFRKRRQKLRDQEDKVAGSREPWHDPATAAAVMGPSLGGGRSANGTGIMHPGWHEYNKEAASMTAARGGGGGSGRDILSMDGGYRHVHHHHPDTRYDSNGEMILIGYADPYGGGEDTTDYLGGHLGGNGYVFSGSDDYGLGLDHAMTGAGSEIGGGGAELASYSGSLAGDHLSYNGYNGSHRYPIPPSLQQHVSSNHPQEEQSASPVPRASYEDDYHAAVALRRQLQQQQQQQQYHVFYPQPPRTVTSAAGTSRQPSRDELGTTTSGTTEATEEGLDDYRFNLEKNSKVEHRRQSPHALLVFGHQVVNQDGETGATTAGVGGIVASPLEGPISNAITGAGQGSEEGGKEGGYRRDDLTSEPGTSSGQGGDIGGVNSHERAPSTPSEETAAALSYLDRLRVDS